MNVGVVDIGSNTVRLVIYKLSKTSYKTLISKKHMAGLAGYVDEGSLNESGVAKALSVIKSCQKTCTNLQIEKIYYFTTASLRNIRNSTMVIDKIEKQLNIKIDLISGEEEARLDFIGSRQSVKLESGVLIDIGGGSTEIVLFKKNKIDQALSLPMGSLKMYSLFVDELLPTSDEIDAIRNYVNLELQPIIASQKKAIAVGVGVGGTVRAARKLYRDILNTEDYPSALPMSIVTSMVDDYNTNELAPLLRIARIIPERIHTIIPGMVILEEVAKVFQIESILVSDTGVREGYLIEKIMPGKGN